MIKYIISIVITLGVGIGIGMWLIETPVTETVAEEAAIYRCPMHPTVIHEEAGSCPICGMDLVKDAPAQTVSVTGGERKIAYWRAPMDPSYTADQPGKSPMGMDLVAVYEDELGAEGTVQIDPVTVQNIGVKTVKVEKRALSRTIRAVGRVDYDETRMTDVNTKINGWVEKLHVAATGQEVEKGQLLLELYSPELVAAQEEYLTALDYKRRLEKEAAADVIEGGVTLLNASAQRLRYWDITDEQIATLERTRKVKRSMHVYSPQEGIVVHKAVFEGAHIKAGQHLYRIAELSHVWIYADIYEYELPWIKAGQDAEVELSYLPGQSFSGKVTYIYPFLNPKTRTAKVRIEFANPGFLLKPDMYANVRFKSLVAPSALVVPVQAIILSGERSVAVVSLGDGKFQPRDIQLGVEADGYYEVLDGLHEDMRIVTSAQFLIDSESNLKAAVSGMTSPSMEENEHAGHQMEETDAGDEHAGHQMEETDTGDEHAGHQMDEMDMSDEDGQEGNGDEHSSSHEGHDEGEHGAAEHEMSAAMVDTSQTVPMDHSTQGDSTDTSHDHSAH